MSLQKKLVLILFVLSVVSCATNRPPQHILATSEQQPSELAVIHLNKAKLRIGAVDGKAVPLALKEYPSFYIQPGSHELRILINYKNFSIVKDQSHWEFSQSLCVTVDAGQEYRVDAAVNTKSWRLRLFDAQGELEFQPKCS